MDALRQFIYGIRAKVIQQFSFLNSPNLIRNQNLPGQVVRLSLKIIGWGILPVLCVIKKS